MAGRVRETIRKLEPVLPELAAHFERNVVAGTYCRYRPDITGWDVDLAGPSPLADGMFEMGGRAS